MERGRENHIKCSSNYIILYVPHSAVLTMNFPFVFFLSFSNFFLSSLARTFPCVVRYSMQKSLISLQNLSIWEGERRRDGRVGGGMGG